MSPLSLAKIEQIAPDQGSLDAARKLLKPAQWPVLATDGAGLVWGDCQGSGSSPYRVIISEEDAGYKCTCPSRKFPCKHALALMWLRAEGRSSFATGSPPDWVADWLSRRRAPSGRPAEPSGASIAAAAEPTGEEAVDPKAEARAAAQRERLRLEREASILRGLDELDIWLGDQIEQGLASFPAVAAERCRLVAQRLVDAKAGALASRIETLAADLFAVPETDRVGWLMSEFGKLHLIAQAYRRQDGLPDDLRADVRQAVGWPVSREALLADPQALRASGRWAVLATRQAVQPDRLRRLETWLALCGEGGPSRFALLVDFVPVSAGAVGQNYVPGENFEAEMHFYPSAEPLRALIGRQTSELSRDPFEWRPSTDLAGALEAHERSVARRPWLNEGPFAVAGAVVRSAGESLWLTDAEGAHGVKIRSSELEAPLTATTLDVAFGLFDGRELSLKFAQTPLGRWTAP